jgi:hypothetical protein
VLARLGAIEAHREGDADRCRAQAGEHLVALGYGGGEAIAQEIEVIGAPASSGAADQVAGEAIDLSTYYRWTRGRQAEPH